MKYAIVENGGKQFRAVEGSTIEVDRLPVDTGVNVKLERVLLLADGENITVGTPLIKDLLVWTTVQEHFRGPKVETFNYSPKKRIRVKIGHRQNYTRLLIEQIGGSEITKKEPVKVEKTLKTSTKEEATKVKAEKPAKSNVKAAAKKPEVKAKAATKVATKTSTKKTTPAKTEAKPAPKGKTASKKTAGK